MSVHRELQRTIAIAAAALAVNGVIELGATALLCRRGHLAAEAARHEPVVVDDGFRYATAGESIYTCTAPHLVGQFELHEDFDCYCAPAGTDALALGERLGGTCTVDKLAPTRLDGFGICRHAHCAEVRDR